jgi:pSer/pThr/pTyr-binding forkhead associated (FHA) protein
MFGLLTVIEGPDKGRMFTLNEREVMLLGTEAHLLSQLRDPAIAPVHCQVQREGKQALLSNGAKSPGTRVNGREITQHVLQSGDVIQIGNTQLSFRWIEGDEKPTMPMQALDRKR